MDATGAGNSRTIELQLARSEVGLRLLTESVTDHAIFMLDPAGYVVSWNSGAERMKGYTEAEILGEHFSKFYTAEDIERKYPAEELTLALRDGRFEDEGWRVRKNGSQFWANVVICPVYDGRGQLTGFAKVTRDFTERKDMEIQLRELNRQLESFAYSVAHDLRSPLRAVAFTSRILLDEATENLSAEHVELVQIQLTSAMKLSKIVDDLLQLARISRQDIGSESVDISGLASEIIEEIWTNGVNGQETGCSFDVQDGLHALGDPTLIQVILWNLIDNGCKFSPDGGTVKVGYHQRKLAFFVSDEGIGFDMEYAEKIFLPFERLVSESEFVGTGIGLANVQRAVMRQGGRIWVESEPGKGTVFYFTLPKAPETKV